MRVQNLIESNTLIGSGRPKIFMINKVRFRQKTVGILASILWIWVAIPFHAATAQTSSLFGGHGPASMAIDIKPDDSENIVRASSGRIIAAAIFGSESLNVIAINPRTIRLNGVDVLLVGKSDKSLCRRPADINKDGYEDLVCDIRTTGFKVGAGEFSIILKAATYNGESLKGDDRIRVVLD